MEFQSPRGEGVVQTRINKKVDVIEGNSFNHLAVRG